MTKHIFLKLIFLLVFLSLNAFAGGNSYVPTDGSGNALFPVYMYGDTGVYEAAFTTAAILSQSTSIMSGLRDTLLMIGGMLGGILYFYSGSLGALYGRVAVILAILLSSYTATCTVGITDLRVNYNAGLYLIPNNTSTGGIDYEPHQTTSYTAVANVPYLLGFLAWGTTSIATDLAVEVESVMANVTGDGAQVLSYSALGLNGAQQAANTLLTKSSLAKTKDGNYSTATLSYMQNCVLKYLYKDPSLTYSVTENQGPMLDNIKYTKFGTDGGEDADFQGATCKQVYDYVYSGKDANATSILSSISKSNTSGLDFTNANLQNALMNRFFFSADTGTSSTATFLDSINNVVFAKAMQDAQVNSNTNPIHANFNNANQLASNYSEGEIAKFGMSIGYFLSKVIPMAILILSGIAYAIFPIMMCFALTRDLQSASSTVANYTAGLFAISMEAVGLAFVQGIQNYYLTTDLASLFSDYAPTSLFGISEYQEQLFMMAGMTGWIGSMVVTMVPVAIMTGGVGMFTSAFNSLAGAFKGPEQAMNAMENTRGHQGAQYADQSIVTLQKALNEHMATRGFQNTIESGSDWNNYAQGIENNAAKSAASTAAFGANTSTENAKSAGNFEGVNNSINTNAQASANSLFQGSSGAHNIANATTSAATNLEKAINAQVASGNLIEKSGGIHEVAKSGITEGVQQAVKDIAGAKSAELAKSLAPKLSEAIYNQIATDLKTQGKVAEVLANSGGAEKTSDLSSSRNAAKTEQELVAAKNYQDSLNSKGLSMSDAAKTLGVQQGHSEAGNVAGVRSIIVQHGATAYDQIAESSARNQAEGALGAIAGAGGVGALARLTHEQSRISTSTSAGTIAGVGADKMIQTQIRSNVNGLQSQALSQAESIRNGLMNQNGSFTIKGAGVLTNQLEQSQGAQIADFASRQEEGLIDSNGNLTTSGQAAITNSAITNAVASNKAASMKQKASSAMNSIIKNIHSAQGRKDTLATYGLTENDIANDGANMSDKALSSFLINNEKVVDHFDMQVLDGSGKVAAVSLNQIAKRSTDGSLTYQSTVSKMSSFQEISTGKKREDHTLDSAMAWIKNGIESIGGSTTLETLEGAGLAAIIGVAGYKLDKSHNGGRIWSSMKDKFKLPEKDRSGGLGINPNSGNGGVIHGGEGGINMGGTTKIDATGGLMLTEGGGKGIVGSGNTAIKLNNNSIDRTGGLMLTEGGGKGIVGSGGSTGIEMQAAGTSKINREPWMTKATLNENDLASAQKSYEKWADGNERAGKFSFDQYQNYVKTKFQEKGGNMTKGIMLGATGVGAVGLAVGENANASELVDIRNTPATQSEVTGFDSRFLQQNQPAVISDTLKTGGTVVGIGAGLASAGTWLASRGGYIAKETAQYVARHVPGVGIAAGTAVATGQALEHNYVGASLTAASTAAMNVPVVGTVGSIAIDGVQLASDMSGATKYLNDRINRKF